MNASSSRAKLRTALEGTFGDHTTATARRTVRLTGESLSQQLQFEKSKEIRSDRQYANTILVGVSAQGGFNFEAIYKEYDLFLESALQSTFSPWGAGGPVAIASPTFAANSLTQTGGTSFVGIAKGQWFQIAGCTGIWVANNGIWQASNTVAATATVLTTETTFTQTGAATGSVTVSSSRLTNGTALRTHDMEVEFNDVAQFFTLRGMGVSKLSLALASKQVVTGTFDFMGKDALALTASSNLPGTDDVLFPVAFKPMNATGNVAMLREGGITLAANVKSLSLDLDNALRAQDAIANISAVGLGNGSVKITGKMSAYFKDAVLFNKAMANTGSSLAFAITDGVAGAGNGYVLSLPALTFTDAQVQAGSQDQDVMADMTFEATIDAISGKTLLIDKFGA